MKRKKYESQSVNLSQKNGLGMPGIHRCAILSDDQKNHVGNDIEDQKEDFKQPEERVNDHVEGFSGNGKPFALRTVHQIRGQYTHCSPEDQQGSVYDCAPHEESCQCLYIHDVPFFSFYILSLIVRGVLWLAPQI